MANRSNFFLFGLFLLIAGCGRDSIPANEYAEWITNEGHNLKLTTEMGEYKISIQYRPISMIALQESNNDPTSAAYENATRELSGMHYFTLRLSSAKDNQRFLDACISSGREINELINYFSFEMKNDLQIIEDGDTISCVLYTFERNYDLTPHLDFSLAFPAKSKSNEKLFSDIQFIYNDQKLGTGPVRFSISAETLSQIPAISHNN